MASARDPSWRLRGFARVMRHKPTDAERRLWSRLRNRQIGGFKFRRQVPIAGYIVDFHCLERKLAIELDGGQHLDPESLEYDKRRAAKLRETGICEMRFASDIALSDTDLALSEIYSELTQNPHPNPLPEYRERE